MSSKNNSIENNINYKNVINDDDTIINGKYYDYLKKNLLERKDPAVTKTPPGQHDTKQVPGDNIGSPDNTAVVTIDKGDDGSFYNMIKLFLDKYDKKYNKKCSKIFKSLNQNEREGILNDTLKYLCKLGQKGAGKRRKKSKSKNKKKSKSKRKRSKTRRRR